MEPRPDREVIVPEPPPGRARAIVLAIGVAWIVLHLLIPLRYYGAGADVYDERFAWRMFSSVRVRDCQVRVTEERGGARTPVALMEVLPAPWVALLERNRPAVVERFLAWRCDREGTDTVELRSTCVDASGEPLDPIEVSMRCADRVIDRGATEREGG